MTGGKQAPTAHSKATTKRSIEMIAYSVIDDSSISIALVMFFLSSTIHIRITYDIR